MFFLLMFVALNVVIGMPDCIHPPPPLLITVHWRAYRTVYTADGVENVRLPSIINPPPLPTVNCTLASIQDCLYS